MLHNLLQTLALILHKAAKDHGIIDSDKVQEIFGISRTGDRMDSTPGSGGNTGRAPVTGSTASAVKSGQLF